MDKEKSMKVWLINRENRYNKREVAKWAARKTFYKACEQRNCFGKIIEGAHPETMSDAEYDAWIKQFAEVRMVM
jgi:hypothetical protein